MKKLTQFLSVLFLVLGLSINAQDNGSRTKSKSSPVSSPSSESQAKASYVKNKEYLLGTSDVPNKNVYGDSLNGFDENAEVARLLTRGLEMKEIKGYMVFLKRQYIQKKYSLGMYAKLKPIINGAGVPPMTNGKPLGGNNTINLAPCVNEDFESTTPGVYTTANGVGGWNITSRANDSQCSPTTWTAGSNEFEIVQTPITSYPGAGFIGNSPLGGNNVARLNDFGTGANNQSMTRLTQTFPVTLQNSVFQFAYAGYWEDGGTGHNCCPTSYDQPGLTVQMYDCNNQPLGCSNIYLSPGTNCGTGATFSTTGAASWTNWQVKVIDLTPYIGSCVTIEFITTDCAFGGHYGSTLIDCKCGGPVLCNNCGIGGPTVFLPGQTVSYCSGSNIAQISAPMGYATYSWSPPAGSPTLSASQATLSTITITNPVMGAVYTVTMITPTGCVFTTTNAINPTTVSIGSVFTNSSCAGGASGSGTVVGFGSGAGYTATWTASNGSVVGTGTVINGLAPGIYTVSLTGLGTSCGIASQTVNIGVKPTGVTPLFQTHCGTTAFLQAQAGTNYQWYNSSLSAIQGANTSVLTVTAPCNGCSYYLRYTTFQGCNDSLKYTLLATTPGALSAFSVSPICVNGSNGTATLNLFPAAGAPTGFNTYSVWSTGTQSPVYNATLSGTSSYSFIPTGLSAGGYSVTAFDGSCQYSTSFTVVPYNWNYSLSVTSASTCPGGSVAVNIQMPFTPWPGQFTYSWSPTTWMFGAINTSSSTLFFPTTASGTSTCNVYNVVVTPTLVNCPIVKTLTICTFNPVTPTINLIPNLCNNSANFTVSTNPPGLSFVTTNTNLPISSNGIISPGNATIGVNNFTAVNTSYTCTAKQTGTFHVSQFVSPALTASVNPLCVTNAAFNLNNIVQNAGGTWLRGTPPAATVLAGGSLNPSIYNLATNPVTGSYPVTYSVNSTPIATVCPSFTTINVSITRTTTPAIIQKPEFCTNASPFSMTVNPTGGGWTSAVNGLINNSGLVTPSSASAAIPAAQVTYTVFDGPCLNTATSTLNVSKFVPAGLSGVVPNLCYNSPAFNLISIAQNTTGTWIYDPALNPNYSPTVQAMIQNNVASPIGVPTGTYVLKYKTTSFPNAALCPDATTIAVQIMNPPTPTITPVPALCNNAAAFQLSVSPNNGFWTTTSYLSNNGVFTPSLSQVGSNAVQFLVGNATCNRQQTQYVSVEAFVSAQILSTVPDQCNNNPAINLTPLTLNNLGKWTGPGINGNSFNPANTGAGQFVLTYTTSSYPSGLCPDQSTVAVSVYSLAPPVITPMEPLCSSALPKKLVVSPLGGTFSGAGFNVVDKDGIFHPGSAMEGNNVISYSVTSGPCKAFAQTTVVVEKFVSAELEQAGPFCKTAEPINMNSFAQNPGGEWTGEGIVTGTSMFHPSMTNSDNVEITHFTYSLPNKLCKDVKSISVNVRSLKALNPVASLNAQCVPAEVVVNLAGTNSGNASWSFEDGSETLTGLSNISHIYTNPGKYKITLNYVDELGCKATNVAVQEFEVHPSPKADFVLPDEVYISDPKVMLNNRSSDVSTNNYIWKLNNEMFSTDVHPTIDFQKIGKYTISLSVRTLHDCVSEITKSLEVKNDFNIFIPNSFSPNGDGLNDAFLPVFTQFGLDTKSFDMEVFDRWGHSLFRTKDFSKGWDGSVQNKGEPLKEGTYVYRIKYKDMDGNSYEKMGNIAILK